MLVLAYMAKYVYVTHECDTCDIRLCSACVRTHQIHQGTSVMHLCSDGLFQILWDVLRPPEGLA